MEDIDKREAELLARLEAERETRIAEKIAAGEIVSVPLFIVGGSETSARAQVEQAKADKLAELRATGDQRAVVFSPVELVITGVVQHGEARDPERAPSAPSFSSGEDASRPRRHDVVAELKSQDDSDRRQVDGAPLKSQDNPAEPVIESYVAVQIGRCEDGDPGRVEEGWFSVTDGQVTVTNSTGGHVGSRVMREGEDAKTVAKRLLRDKQAPEQEFNRPLHYPNVGLT